MLETIYTHEEKQKTSMLFETLNARQPLSENTRELEKPFNNERFYNLKQTLLIRYLRIRKSKFHFRIGDRLQIEQTDKANLNVLNKLICLEFQNNIFHFCKVKIIRSNFYIIEDEFNIQKKISFEKFISVNYINELIINLYKA